MAIHRLGFVTKRLTPEIALEFATMRACKCERPANEKRLSWLRGLIDAEKFYSPRWAVAFLNGQQYRVNGQNSSMVLAESNGSFPHGMDVIIDQFKVDSEQDLADLWSEYFDAAGSSRTSREIINAHAAVEDDLADMKRRSLSQIIGGIALVAGGERRFSLNDRASLIHYHKDFIHWAYPFMADAKLCRVSATGAMFMTWEKSASKATQFWTLVSNESHPDPTNASRTLSRILYDASRLKRQARTEQVRHNKRELLVKCIRCANAWAAGRTTLAKVLGNDMKKLPALEWKREA